MATDKYLHFLVMQNIAVEIIIAVVAVIAVVFLIIMAVGKRMSERNMKMIDKYYGEEEDECNQKTGCD